MTAFVDKINVGVSTFVIAERLQISHLKVVEHLETLWYRRESVQVLDASRWDGKEFDGETKRNKTDVTLWVGFVTFCQSIKNCYGDEKQIIRNNV